MRRIIIVGVLTMAMGMAWAQQPATNAVVARQQLAAIEAQLSALRTQARESPETDAARKAAMDAEKAYADALAAIPEIKALDDQIAAARDQMRELMIPWSKIPISTEPW